MTETTPGLRTPMVGTWLARTPTIPAKVGTSTCFTTALLKRAWNKKKYLQVLIKITTDSVWRGKGETKLLWVGVLCWGSSGGGISSASDSGESLDSASQHFTLWKTKVIVEKTLNEEKRQVCTELLKCFYLCSFSRNSSKNRCTRLKIDFIDLFLYKFSENRKNNVQKHVFYWKVAGKIEIARRSIGARFQRSGNLGRRPQKTILKYLVNSKEAGLVLSF